MKFGAVTNIEAVNFSLPADHPNTAITLSKLQSKTFSCHVGFAKWDPKYIQGFYPKGIGKNQLEYYSTYINCIEMNAFYYRIFPPEYVVKWHDRAEETFTFCPKLPQVITQFRRLKDCDEQTTKFLNSIRHFKSKLGTCFIQMHPSFTPEKLNDLIHFIEKWPKDVPLAVELRHSDWFNEQNISNRLYGLFETHNISNIITDTAGRRDLMHMRLTNQTAFVRFTGCNHPSDYTRLDDWLDRLEHWKKMGINQLYFFIHQHDGHKSMDLYNHFTEGLGRLGVHLPKV